MNDDLTAALRTQGRNNSQGDGAGLVPIGFHPEQDPISADDLSPCLGAGAGAVAVGWDVRRLTPVERERLMDWPDGYTAWGIDDAGRRIEIADTHRERLTGNGVVASHGEWLARRMLSTPDNGSPGEDR